VTGRRLAVLGVAALVGSLFVTVNALGSASYGVASFGDPRKAPLADVAGLSQHHFVSRLEALQREMPAGRVLSNASSTTIAKVEQTYSARTPIFFFGVHSRYEYQSVFTLPGIGEALPSGRSYRSRLGALIKAHTALYELHVFPRPDGETFDRFVLDARIPRVLEARQRLWFLDSPNPTLLNTHATAKSYDVALVPFAGVHDTLVLVPSLRASAGIFDRGARFAPGIMLSRSEPDPLVHGGQVEAVGRYLLFAVVNPSPAIRLVIDFTATLDADGSSSIPPISVIGTRRTAFAVAGRGAARLVSPPLTPRLVDGVPMIEIDMGTDGKPFREHRTGLLALFGAQYHLDPRRLVGFVRDISVISEDAYRRARPPSAIASFPAGLRDRDLEYSGFYEDGWVSNHAVARLTAPRGGRHAVVVRGSLPELAGVTESVVHVKLDGVDVVAQPILPGPFEVRANVRADGRPHQVVLTFEGTFRLPNGDDRLTAAQLSFVGYE